MAGSEGYSIGGLKLAFNALDQTSDDFKKLATNLRAIANLINRISTADLGKFTANVKQITQAFNPFLTEISKSTDGITRLNNAVSKVGVGNVSNVAQNFDDLQNKAQGAAESAGKFKVEIKSADEAARGAADSFSDFKNKTEEVIDTFDKAQAQIAKLTKEMLNMHFGTGVFDSSAINDIKDFTARTNETSEALKRELMTEQELLVYDARHTEQVRKKRIEYLQLAIATGQVASEELKYRNELNSLLVEQAKFESSLKALKQPIDEIAQSVAEIPTPFNVAQAQVSKLTQEMLNLHFATGNLDNGAIQEIRELTSAISASQNAVKQALMSEEELVIEKYKDIQATRKQRIAYLEAELAMGASGKQARQYAKELAELRKQDGQVGKKSGFSKFLGQVKRIAIYRLIRSGLKAVTGAFKDGIGALAQFDSGVNKTMSQLTTSFTVMKLSVSMALVPLLQSITPIIQQISVGFANMANVISASMSKTGKYTKIATDRLLAYNKAGNVFDFDKFRALSKGGDAGGLLEEGNVEDLNKELGESKFAYSAIFNVIKQISVLAGNVFETVRQIIDAVVTSPITAILLNVAQTLIGIVAGVVNLINKSGILKPIVNAILIGLTGWGASKVIKGITTLYGKFGMLGVALSAITISLGIIGNWDNFSEGTKKAITAISTLITVLTTAAFAALALNSALTLGTGVALAVTAFSAGAVMLKGFGLFANGGMPDKGSLFVAGESGAEFVYNMPSGQSGVANIQQIAQAMKAGCLAALQEYGASRGDLGDISFDLDGEQIYRNTTSHAKKHGYAWRKV